MRELPALYMWSYQPAADIDSIQDVNASAMYPTVEVVTHRLLRSVTLIAIRRYLLFLSELRVEMSPVEMTMRDFTPNRGATPGGGPKLERDRPAVRPADARSPPQAAPELAAIRMPRGHGWLRYE